MTWGRLWNYYRDQIDNVDNTALAGKPFNYKTKIVGKTPQRLPRPENEGYANQQPQPLVPPINVEVIIQLKYRSNFSRFLDIPLINYEIELDLSWTKDCVFSQHHNNITRATFQINNAKLYVPNVTLSINDNNFFLENIKPGFQRTSSWNKYRSKIKIQPNNNRLDYQIDPVFRNIDRLFVLLFKNNNKDLR